MSARELHDLIQERGLYDFAREQATQYPPAPDVPALLRALDLLARVEESEDELVRDLLEEAEDLETAFGRSGRTEMLRKAAADIVALRAELAEWKASGEKMAQKFNEVVAERDQLKAHAEAMAQLIRMFTWMDKHGVQLPAGLYAQVSEYEAAVLAYRRDFPRTP